MADHLSSDDVARLLADPSPATRAEMAAKVAHQLGEVTLSDNERQIAEEIIRIMAQDAVMRVRQSLAENLKLSTSLPHDVARKLAQDVEAVALPVLAVSQVLTDADLVEVVRSGSAAKQTAIARRPELSSRVADALVDHGDAEVVAVLVANEGAELGEHSLQKVVDRFGDTPLVHEPLVHRSRLPLTVAERLVALVSERLQDYLVTHHELPAGLASDLILRSRERATVALFSGDTDDADVERLVCQLQQHGRLSPSLLLRALCMGDLTFFEAGLAELANVPVTNARILIHDAGPLGLKSIYEKARLPQALLPAVRVALDVLRETDYDGREGDRERHRRKVLERILTQYVDLAADDLGYLLDKLGDLVGTA